MYVYFIFIIIIFITCSCNVHKVQNTSVLILFSNLNPNQFVRVKCVLMLMLTYMLTSLDPVYSSKTIVCFWVSRASKQTSKADSRRVAVRSCFCSSLPDNDSQINTAMTLAAGVPLLNSAQLYTSALPHTTEESETVDYCKYSWFWNIITHRLTPHRCLYHSSRMATTGTWLTAAVSRGVAQVASRDSAVSARWRGKEQQNEETHFTAFLLFSCFKSIIFEIAENL